MSRPRVILLGDDTDAVRDLLSPYYLIGRAPVPRSVFQDTLKPKPRRFSWPIMPNPYAGLPNHPDRIEEKKQKHKKKMARKKRRGY